MKSKQTISCSHARFQVISLGWFQLFCCLRVSCSDSQTPQADAATESCFHKTDIEAQLLRIKFTQLIDSGKVEHGAFSTMFLSF